MLSKYIEIVTTTRAEEEAVRIGSTLVEAQLAACVQVRGPIKSIYWWESSLQTDSEWELKIKTSRALKENVIAKIKALHSYELPQIVVFNIQDGSHEYLHWIDDNCRSI